MNKWMPVILAAALAIPTMATSAFAVRTYLNDVNAACGTTYDCGLCHIKVTGGGPLTAAGTGYVSANYDPKFFCSTPAPPPCTDADGDKFFKEAGCGTAVDCNDNDKSVYPGAPEICNDGKDNDCDGKTDCADSNCTNDPACAPPAPACTDADGDGYYKEPGCGSAVDCNDSNASVHPGAVEVCNNFVDDDCDGMTDCADTDCAADPACAAQAPTCTDADNDGYYKQAGCGTSVDCNDNNPDINQGVAENCTDGIDNDCDGLIDCADDDCAAAVNCTPASTPEDCNDGIDNDGDGLIDCADNDCGRDPACSAPAEAVGAENTNRFCRDGLDNDGDGLIDCDDPDCENTKSCIEGRGKTCRDGIDNDRDGLIDCDDPDCADRKPCIEGKGRTCSDGIDNDRDGLIDCDDPDCARNRSCRDNITGEAPTAGTTASAGGPDGPSAASASVTGR